MDVEQLKSRGDAERAGSFYANSLQHLMAELERIDLLIQEQVEHARAVYLRDPAFQGLYISEQEIDALLARPAGLPHWAREPRPKSGSTATLDDIAAGIRQRADESTKQEVSLRLVELARKFELSSSEIDVLLVCLAPEFDLRYEQLYAYLQDDITKKRPSVDLVLNLLCRTYDRKMKARGYFAPRAPLLVNGLVRLFEDPSHQAPPLLSQYLKLDRRVVDYLLGSDEPCEELLPYAHLETTEVPVEALVLPQRTKDQLERTIGTHGVEDEHKVFYFHGPRGVGRQVTAASVAKRLGIPLLTVDGSRLAEARDLEFKSAMALLGRELRLQNTGLCWLDLDNLLSDNKQTELGLFLDVVRSCAAPVLVTGQRAWEPGDALQRKSLMRIEIPLPGCEDRVALWRSALGQRADLQANELQALAGSFRLSGRQIRDAVASACNSSLVRDPESLTVTAHDLNTACRLHSNQKLTELADKIVPRYQWSDIVIPGSELAQLREIQNVVKYRHTVYQKWGFDRKLSLGKGLSVLFSGPSGTGKTMAAEVVANALGVDLYKIDLSLVVSKFIGETEKNLSRIFDEAETSNAILFFDEADALFGRRSQVKDSHDRYANIETGYLLQRMEAYEGVVILATNLPNNLDEAFSRRMAFAVGFPLPDEPHRLRIWTDIWPEQTPLADDIDLEFMAKQFRLAGGNIKNIALAAAFLAADDGGIVGMKHVIRATRRELEKIGKVCVESEFGPYYPLIAA